MTNFENFVEEITKVKAEDRQFVLAFIIGGIETQLKYKKYISKKAFLSILNDAMNQPHLTKNE